MTYSYWGDPPTKKEIEVYEREMQRRKKKRESAYLCLDKLLMKDQITIVSYFEMCSLKEAREIIKSR